MTEDGLLVRCSISNPLPRNAETAKILLSLLQTPCSCEDDDCDAGCPHRAHRATPVPREAGPRPKKRPKNLPPEDSAIDFSRIPAVAAAQTSGKKIDPSGPLLPDFRNWNVCVKSTRLVVPSSLVTSVLYHAHGSGVAGHPGTTRATARARRRFWWKGMLKDIRDWVAACLPCQQRKPTRPRNVNKPGCTRLPKGPMQEIYIDFSGPFPETPRGNRHILGIVCAYSRYPIAVPLPNRSAVVVARALLEHVIQHYSCPLLIISDAAREFTGTVMNDFCRVFGIRKHTNPAYSPELSCYVERYHAWQGACLTILTSRFKTDWDLMLPLVSLAYRTTVHARTGFTPFEVLHGFEPRMPFDAWCPWNCDKEPRSTEVRELQEKMRAIYTAVKDAHDKATSQNRERRLQNYREQRFEPGDLVLCFAPKTAEVLPKDVPVKPKLMDRWSLPKMVVARGDNGVYVVRDASGTLSDYRADAMRHYRFYKDGLPSVPARRKFTADERRARNAALKRPKIRDAKVGDLVCFPMEMRDGPGFGVGEVLSVTQKSNTRTYNIQFYSNASDSLTGTFRPCWMDHRGKWYCGQRERPSHKAVTTGEYYPSPIRQSVLAAVGFALLPDDRMPMPVLRAMSIHPDFQWSLPDDDDHDASP